MLTFAPTISATVFLFLRAQTSHSNWFIKLLGPTGLLIAGFLLTWMLNEPWSYFGLIFLTVCYFLKKLLTTNELFFHNWTLALLIIGTLYFVALSMVASEQLRETQQQQMEQMDEYYQLQAEKNDADAQNAQLEAELKLCEQGNEKTGS